MEPDLKPEPENGRRGPRTRGKRLPGWKAISVDFDPRLARILRGMGATYGLSLGGFLEAMAIRALCGRDPLTEEERRLIKELCRLHGLDLEKMASAWRLGGCAPPERAGAGGS